MFCHQIFPYLSYIFPLFFHISFLYFFDEKVDEHDMGSHLRIEITVDSAEKDSIFFVHFYDEKVDELQISSFPPGTSRRRGHEVLLCLSSLCYRWAVASCRRGGAATP